MKRISAAAVIIVLLLCGVGTLFGVLYYVRARPPALSQNPPIYPNAQQVSIQTVKLPGDEPGIQIYKTVQFSSGDSPAQIFSFYQSRLMDEGWDSGQLKANSITYLKFGGGRSGPMYVFTVIAQQQTPGQTDVEIRLGLHPGY